MKWRDKMTEWKQIHTNGATTTFARYYQQDDGAYRFQKLSADHTAEPTGFAEIFGDEVLATLTEATTRLDEAVRSGV
jgi:hypothetical protein